MAFSTKNFILGVAIFILTIIVGITGILTIYGEGPVYGDFCSNKYHMPRNNEEVCPAVCNPLYVLEDDECVFDDCGSGCGADNYETFETLEECEEALLDSKCHLEYDEAQESYHKKLFLTALPLGILVIVAGALFFGLEAVGGGLMMGGVGIIFFGVTSYWRFTENWMKFIISLVGLTVVIFLAYYWNDKFGKKK